MAKIVTLKDHKTNEDAYPQTRSEAVYMSDSTTLEQFKSSVAAQFNNYPNVIVNGTVTNLPDNEDIRETEQHTLQLADRNNLEGMGYVILRRNKSFAGQLTQENTIYEIRYDFDLNGDSVTIPAGCILKFCGGSLSDGTIVGDDTCIAASPVKIFDDIQISGSFNIEFAYAEWFGAKANSESYQDTYINLALANFNRVKLLRGVYKIEYPIIMTSYQTLEGVAERGNDSTNETRIIKDTTYPATGIPVTLKGVDLNVDSVIIIKPLLSADGGDNQFMNVSISNVWLQGNRSGRGIMMSDGRYCYLSKIAISDCMYGVKTEYTWMVKLVSVLATSNYAGQRIVDSVGFDVNNAQGSYSGYTTFYFEQCYAMRFDYGYRINSLSYASMQNCACDGCYRTAYKITTCPNVCITGNGSESTVLTDDSDSCSYYIYDSSVSLINCTSVLDGSNSDITDKYWLKAVGNAHVELINPYHLPNKIRSASYSQVRIFLGRVDEPDPSPYETDEHSNIEIFRRNHIIEIIDGVRTTLDLPFVLTLRSGSTSGRPSGLGGKIGTPYFDRSLGGTGKPIWWDGTQWVDATGTAV